MTTLALAFAIIIFAALIHASFQLGISVMTLLSGHSLRAKAAHHNSVKLTTWFVFGAASMTFLLTATSTFVISQFLRTSDEILWWTVAVSVLGTLAIAVWLFYYRPGSGTSLWIPRSVADFLLQRTKATKHGAEAFSLGLSSVIGEILFLVGPLLVASLAILSLPESWQLAGILTYVAVSLVSLFIVWVALLSGSKLSGIQHWRERNKRFLQFIAGIGLLVLGFFVFVYEVIGIIEGIS